jgi:hypothetical protein
MSALEDAIFEGNLEKVKRLVAEGTDGNEADAHGFTALPHAALYGLIPIMDWLLNEGGSSLTEKDINGASASLLCAFMGCYPAMQYLLEEQEASISESDNNGDTVWNIIILRNNLDESADLSSLLKVMVMLEDAPADFIANPGLSLQQAEICTRGRQLRAQLPSYLEQQQAAFVTYALPLACRATIPRRRVRRDHSGGHVGGRAAHVSVRGQTGQSYKGRGSMTTNYR